MSFSFSQTDFSILLKFNCTCIILKYNIQFNDIESAMSEFSLKREELRSNKKYGEADKMREDLLEIGIVMNDGENVGWYWKNS